MEKLFGEQGKKGDEGKKRLGRGLASLLSEASESFEKMEKESILDSQRVYSDSKINDRDKLREYSKNFVESSSVEGSDTGLNSDNPSFLPMSSISFNPDQPRKFIASDALEELAQSVREHGILQPLIVRKIGPGNYQIVVGERRYHAARRAGLQEIPVLIKELNDINTFEIALIENIQRQDMTPIEEGEAYQKMIDSFGYTQETIAKKLGKSRSHIANTIRLLKLPDQVRRMVMDGTLSPGHARTILNSEDPVFWAEKIVREGLSVRDIERVIRENDRRGEKNSNNKGNNHLNNNNLGAADNDLRKISSDNTQRNYHLEGNIKRNSKNSQSEQTDGYHRYDDSDNESRDTALKNLRTSDIEQNSHILADYSANMNLRDLKIDKDLDTSIIDPDIVETESILARNLGMKVQIRAKGDDGYSVLFHCKNLDQLDFLLTKISGD